ncbi:MAG: ClpX C4-type zinc finger protein, partial [Clostridia bacterium]
MNDNNDNSQSKCSFCGRKKDSVNRLFANPTGECAICENCLEICKIILQKEDQLKKRNDLLVVPSPSKLNAELNKFIIGQDKAKKVLSVAVYNH